MLPGFQKNNNCSALSLSPSLSPSLSLSLSLSSFSLAVVSCPVSYLCLWCFGEASEGKMVVLSLAIGLAEQDDFANIPDLQETAQAAPTNQEPTPPDKRYQAKR